jgi:membrane-bound lytic murein transglycosylase F
MTYEEIFKAVAPQFGLDWRLLAAIAYQESRYNPFAVGRYGEYGLMQIMPATWDLMAPQVGASNPWDPYSNVLVSAAFLAFLRDSFSASGYPEYYWVLVGYNWGPGNVRQLWSNGQGWDHVPAVPRRYAEEVWTAASGTIPAWIEPHLTRTVSTLGDPRLGMRGTAK